MKTITVCKGQVLQRKGDVNTNVFFVESGMLRSYTIDQNGREHIFMFAPEGWTIADFRDVDVPAQLYIDALEDSTVRVRKKELEKESIDTRKCINRVMALQNRIVSLLSTNAIERYEIFVKTYPEIAKRVPQKMIASYIGVTQETLSAAKRHWLKESKRVPREI